MRRPKPNSPRRLVVEGRDDVFAVASLAEARGLPRDVYVHDAEGVDELLTSIPVELKASWSHLGIVVDADLDRPARWQAV